MINASDIAQARHSEAVDALKQWSTTNEQRTELAVTVQAALAQGHESPEALAAYMKLSEIEMVRAGAAIMALSECLVAFGSAYREKTGEPLIAQLSALGDTQGT